MKQFQLVGRDGFGQCYNYEVVLLFRCAECDQDLQLLQEVWLPDSRDGGLVPQHGPDKGPRGLRPPHHLVRTYEATYTDDRGLYLQTIFNKNLRFCIKTVFNLVSEFLYACQRVLWEHPWWAGGVHGDVHSLTQTVVVTSSWNLETMFMGIITQSSLISNQIMPLQSYGLLFIQKMANLPCPHSNSNTCVQSSWNFKKKIMGKISWPRSIFNQIAFGTLELWPFIYAKKAKFTFSTL